MQCQCLTTQNKQCSRKGSLVAGKNPKYCHQHQDCIKLFSGLVNIIPKQPSPKQITPKQPSPKQITPKQPSPQKIVVQKKSKPYHCAISTAQTPLMENELTQVYLITGGIGSICAQNTPGPVAVVNAANAQLATGGGVTGALVTAVGGATKWHQLVSHALDIKGQQAKLPLTVGGVASTLTDGQLKSNNVKYIIHGLGPVPPSEPMELVTNTVRNVLSMADKLGVKSLVLPAISGGIFVSFDEELGKKIRALIVGTIRAYVKAGTQIQKIYLISYDPNDQKLWLGGA